jgi:hypothetical protein
MGLPAVLRSRLRPSTEKSGTSSPSSPTSKEELGHGTDLTDASIKQATRMRRGFALSASFAYLVSWIFLVLVRYLFPNHRIFHTPILTTIPRS